VNYQKKILKHANAEQFEKRAEEQDQLLKEREEFKKRIGN
jgi:hypothetical protein